MLLSAAIVAVLSGDTDAFQDAHESFRTLQRALEEYRRTRAAL